MKEVSYKIYNNYLIITLKVSQVLEAILERIKVKLWLQIYLILYEREEYPKLQTLNFLGSRINFTVTIAKENFNKMLKINAEVRNIINNV